MVDTISSPYSTPPRKSKNKTVMIVAVVLIVAVLIGFLLLRNSKQTASPQSATTESVTPEPTATPTPKIDKSTVKIQVQNGTGTPGQAASAVDALKTAGYNADNIKTGNADSTDNTVTTISAKSGFESTANDIKEALSSTFTDIKVSSTVLESSSDFDIVIITGGKKFVEPSPTAGGTKTSPTSAPSVTPSSSSTPTPTPTP